jgi:hypothetical protein
MAGLKPRPSKKRSRCDTDICREVSDQESRRVIMRRISILLLFSVVCFATAMQAQAPAPKPGPEVRKLHAALGHWTIDGEQKPGPLGPGGRFTGEAYIRMILGGFFLQNQQSGEVAGTETRLLEIDGYDPVNKNFFDEVYVDDGSRSSTAILGTGLAIAFENGRWYIGPIARNTNSA